jgi:chromosome segregation ATPase
MVIRFGDEDPCDALEGRFQDLQDDYAHLEAHCSYLQEELDVRNLEVAHLKKDLFYTKRRIEALIKVIEEAAFIVEELKEDAKTKNSR